MPSSTSNLAPPPPLVPQWLIWSMVAVCLGLATALVPSRKELIGMHLADGNSQRALEVAHTTGGVQEPELPLSPMGRLQAALSPDFHGSSTIATLAIQTANDPTGCLALLEKTGASLTREQKIPLYLAVTKSALAHNNPKLAAQVATNAIHAGLSDPALRHTAIQAWRWADQPGEALKVFDHWRQSDPATLDIAAEDLEIALSRETGSNQRALPLLLARLRSNLPGTTSTALMELTLTVAANAGKTELVLPHISAWVAAQPAGTASMEDLASGKIKPDDKFLHFAGLLARHSEWTLQLETAFEWFSKLAVLGDSFALERAAQLQIWLNRSTDFMALLQHIVPVPEQPKYTRQLARLLGESGLYDQAPAIYEKWLKDNPKDITALSELAALYSEIPDPPKALALYQKVTSIDPGNLNARKEIADLNLVLKNYPAAFQFYNSLPENDHDALTLENFSLLAESLGDYPAYHRALLIRYHRLHEPTTNDFLELARSFELVNKPDGAITTLTEGLRRLPKSRVIRTHLAQSWRNRGNYDEAIKLLAVNSLKTDLMAMSLFIEVCCLKEDYQQALAFLGRGIEKKFGFPPDVLLDLGHIYFNNGYMTEADALYSSVPDEPTLWPLIANARYRRGDLAGAETYQKRYLNATQVPDPQGWLLMGDILRACGRESEAQQAYQRSLLLMEQKLDPLATLPDAPLRPTTASNP